MGPVIWSFVAENTLRAEIFAGKNFCDFRNFGPFSGKLITGKKLNEQFAKVIFAKKNFFKIRENISKFEKNENKKGTQRKV